MAFYINKILSTGELGYNLPENKDIFKTLISYFDLRGVQAMAREEGGGQRSIGNEMLLYNHKPYMFQLKSYFNVFISVAVKYQISFNKIHNSTLEVAVLSKTISFK